MAIRVGRWDCLFCGHRGNLGPEKNCAACGKPRGKDVKFYLPEDAPEVTDADEITRAEAGPDWNCDYCGASNSFNNDSCQGCGNAKTQTDQSLQIKDYSLSDVPRNGGSVNPGKTSPVPKKKKYNWIIYVGIALLLPLVSNRIAGPRIIDVTVTGHEWKRIMEVENYRLVQHEDWDVPQNALIIDRFQAVHHNNQVFDHYETRTRTVRVKVGEERYVSGQRDKGNGYFEDIYSTRPIYEDRVEEYQVKVYRDVPVYQTRYLYKVYEWVVDRTVTAEGHDKNCNWPTGAPPNKKTWRNGTKEENYTLLFKDSKGSEYQIETDFNHWQALNDHDTIKARKTFDKLELIDELEKK
jgi:hypothetical protein